MLIPIIAVAQTAQDKAQAPTGPPIGGGFFPLKDVHRGLMGTAWTVFTGSRPESMDVEILGVLKGARGPGHDMILAQLRGAKPEYTGVVAGMSGSPVYIGNRLLGSLSYRIGQFSKDPIAGITPIEQMLEVRDLPIQGSGIRDQESGTTSQPPQAQAQNTMQLMETPLVMGGFHPEAIKLWQQKMAGTGLEMVAAGGMSGSSGLADTAPSPQAIASIIPGSAVSALLVRGDVEIAATCTVTYVDRKQLLACGHPLLQAGPVSLPMTATEVVATLASPFNAFKIVNTGATIGAFTEDRDSALRGVFNAQARMIPLHINVHGEAVASQLQTGNAPQSKERKLNVEILDMPSLTPQAVMVVLYESMLQSNESSAQTSYHLTGSIELEGYPASPLNLWASGGESNAAMETAVTAAEQFARLYSNETRQGAVRAIQIDIEAIPHRVDVELESARLLSGNIVHAGDTVTVEATLRSWQQPSRNLRIPVKLPARLGAGNLRLLVSDSGTLERALEQPRQPSHSLDIDSA
ncbi:MAG TPA: SpoIVB peptidase S55, partial [Terracidiphilus sp.]